MLIVAQKAVREYWENLGALPPNVEFGHYNAIAGIDRWGPQIDQEGNLIDLGVRLLVLVGRILIPSTAAENGTRALTGLGLGSLAGGYLKTTTRRLLANGQSIPAETDWHPHPIAEAIRWQACEGELIQGAGRGRPANRTAANPLDVLIFSDRVMPFPVEPVSWDEMKPDWHDMMLAEGGVALECAAHAAKAYPKIRGKFGDDGDKGISSRAMRLALWREGDDRSAPAKCVSDPYRDPSREMKRTSHHRNDLLPAQGARPIAAGGRGGSVGGAGPQGVAGGAARAGELVHGGRGRAAARAALAPAAGAAAPNSAAAMRPSPRPRTADPRTASGSAAASAAKGGRTNHAGGPDGGSGDGLAPPSLSRRRLSRRMPRRATPPMRCPSRRCRSRRRCCCCAASRNGRAGERRPWWCWSWCRSH